MRRIRQISIKNLFGIFYHDIMLNMDERVTIIHSPNGFGKTAILKLLNELFTQSTNVLRTTPFDEFHIYFEDQTHFWVERKLSEVGLSNESGNVLGKAMRRQIMCYYSNSEGEQVSELELTEKEVSIERLRGEL